VEVYLRDHAYDQGRDEGVPVLPPDAWDSPDVKVTSVEENATAPLDYEAFASAAVGRVHPGERHRVLVQVGNRGWRTASTITVRVFVSTGTALPPLPQEGVGDQGGGWRPVGSLRLLEVSQTNPGVGALEWEAPPTGGVVHLLVIADAPEDPLRARAGDVTSAVRRSRQMAIERVRVDPGP
jgi:hypothetical protein